mmetsp:Transcript_72304/g.215767  ORF Transcript_72304/g.215767 Transcript_72304/m.215767 type:complete len:166 (+) Transcript_72304:84-581(+)
MGRLGALAVLSTETLALLVTLTWALACISGGIIGYIVVPMSKGRNPRFAPAMLFVTSGLMSGKFCLDVATLRTPCCSQRAKPVEVSSMRLRMALKSLALWLAASAFFAYAAGPLDACAHKKDSKGNCATDVTCSTATSALTAAWVFYVWCRHRNAESVAPSSKVE